jgi:hypothetical protein
MHTSACDSDAIALPSATEKMRMMLLICNMGLIFSAAVALYSGALWYVLTESTQEVLSPAVQPDTVLAKVEADLHSDKLKKAIVAELRGRREYADKLRALLSDVIADSRMHAKCDALFWLSTWIMFLVLRLRWPRLDKT